MSPALFDELGNMRKANKASLATHIREKHGGSDATAFTRTHCLVPAGAAPAHASGTPIDFVIVDACACLRRVGWKKGAMFKDVAAAFVNAVVKQCGHVGVANVVLVADGCVGTTTKSGCQAGACAQDPCPDQTVDDGTSLQFDRDAFLGNETNKTRVLKHVEGKATAAGTKWEQRPADADLPIVKAALRCAEGYKRVVFVGEDTDLLVLLPHHYDPTCHGEVLLMPEDKRGPKSATTPSANIRAIRADMANAGGLPEAILLLHALFGCDTTSSLLGLGKTKCLGKHVKHGPCRAGRSTPTCPLARRQRSSSRTTCLPRLSRCSCARAATQRPKELSSTPSDARPL